MHKDCIAAFPTTSAFHLIHYADLVAALEPLSVIFPSDLQSSLISFANRQHFSISTPISTATLLLSRLLTATVDVKVDRVVSIQSTAAGICASH